MHVELVLELYMRHLVRLLFHTNTCSIERGLCIFWDCIDNSCWDCPKPACMCLQAPVWNSGRSDCGGLSIFQCCAVECVPCQHFDCFWFHLCYHSGQWLWVHYQETTTYHSKFSVLIHSTSYRLFPLLSMTSSTPRLYLMISIIITDVMCVAISISTCSTACCCCRCWGGPGEVRVQSGWGDLSVSVCSLF